MPYLLALSLIANLFFSFGYALLAQSWIAFSCGLFIGVFAGITLISILSAAKGDYHDSLPEISERETA